MEAPEPLDLESFEEKLPEPLLDEPRELDELLFERESFEEPFFLSLAIGFFFLMAFFTVLSFSFACWNLCKS